MKKAFYISLFVISVMPFVAMINPASSTKTNPGSSIAFMPGDSFPEDIMNVFDKSCFDCHSDRSGNFSAKGKLNFSNWNEYSPAKKVSKMDAICVVVNNGKMPKKKYISKNPDKALSQAEKELICKWAEEESKKLVGE